MGLTGNTANRHQTCIDACLACSRACFECFRACLNEPDLAARKNCVAMLVDCAEICSLAAAYMSRDSQLSVDICKLCATICEKCAQDCSMFKDEHCKKCADYCNQCATECEKMANM